MAKKAAVVVAEGVRHRPDLDGQWEIYFSNGSNMLFPTEAAAQAWADEYSAKHPADGSAPEPAAE